MQLTIKDKDCLSQTEEECKFKVQVMHVIISYINPPSLFFSLVAIWPPTAQVWSPVKNFSR